MPPTEQFEDTKRSTKKIKAMGSRRIEGDDIPYLFTLSRLTAGGLPREAGRE